MAVQVRESGGREKRGKARARPPVVPAPAKMRIEWWPVSRPKPSPTNPRVHPEEQVEQIAKSIAEFGQVKPIICDEHDEILAGHGTLAGAVRAGKLKVAVVVKHGLSPEQKKAYRIADNQIGLNSDWDRELLKADVKELHSLGFDLDLTALPPLEIEAFTVEMKKVKREKVAHRQKEDGHKVVCPQCRHKFRVE